MRVAGLLPPVALAAGLALVGLNWQTVTSAYREHDRPVTDVKLSGVDLGLALSPLGPSPYAVTPAPDTRTVEVDLARPVDAVPDPAPPRPSVTGGSAALAGSVRLPDGAAAGAVIRLERHTVDGMAALDVTAGPDGRWGARNLAGGRYRVRAWLPGSATMTGSEVFFLGADQARMLDFDLEPVDPTPRMRFSHKGDIYLGGTGTVAVSVTVRSVDDDGFVVVSGLAGAIVTLTPTGAATVTSPTVTADGDGVARFQLSCDQLGATSAVISHQGATIRADLPACIPVPPPPTTVPDPATAPTVAGSPQPGASPTTRPGTTTTRVGNTTVTTRPGTTRG